VRWFADGSAQAHTNQQGPSESHELAGVEASLVLCAKAALVRPLRINPISGQNFQEPLIILRQYPGVVTDSASIPVVRAKGFGALPILRVGQKRSRAKADD
jgi:hypothetical protein